MRSLKFVVPALFATSTLFFSSAFAQPSPLTNRLATVSEGLGAPLAISGDIVVAFGEYDYRSEVFLFQKSPGGWGPETQTATLTASDGAAIGSSVAISGDTVFVGGSGKVYIYVKPASGWTNMHETAQLTVSDNAVMYFGSALAVDGDTLVVTAKGSTAFVFLEPAGGWAAATAYQAKLAIPTTDSVNKVAVSGDTIVLGFYSDEVSGLFVNVYQKPESGWAGTLSSVASLTRSTVDLSSAFGDKLAISGDTIAVAAPYTAQGVVDLFVKPATGWANATETVELTPPPAPHTISSFGSSLAMDSSHLLVGSASSRAFVYSQPATGWGTFEWPSQEFVGDAASSYSEGSAFGEGVALDGNTTAIGATGEIIPPATGFASGAVYVYTLAANPILVSTDFLLFPDMNFGSTEQLSLTVTNSGTETLYFTTSMDSANYQVLETGENTCSAGIPAGQSCVLPIEFNPPAVGVHTNHLTLTSAATGALRIVEMRGYAGGVGAASEAPLEVEAAVGSSQTVPLVLANFGVPGLPTVALSFSDPEYSLASAGTCAAGVPEGGTCTMMIKFAPVTPGNYKRTIGLTPSSGAASSVAIQGYAYTN